MIKVEIEKKVYKKLFFSNIGLNKIDFNFKEKKSYGLIGENGAGKSTLIKCLLGLEDYNGKIETNFNTCAYSPDYLDFYSDQYSLEYLFGLQTLLSQKIDADKINQLLDTFYLLKHEKTPISRYSKGMKKKINLIQALMQQVDVYVFDEPTDGLDPIMRRAFLDEIKKLKSNEKTIILSTHRLEDLDEVADELLIFYKGHLIDSKKKEDVYHKYNSLEDWYINSINIFDKEIENEKSC